MAALYQKVATKTRVIDKSAIAHPVNVLMMIPGGYTARDFAKVGSSMTAVTFVMLLAGLRINGLRINTDQFSSERHTGSDSFMNPLCQSYEISI